MSRFKGLGEMPPAQLQGDDDGPGEAHAAEGGGAARGTGADERSGGEPDGRRPELRFQFIQERADGQAEAVDV